MKSAISLSATAFKQPIASIRAFGLFSKGSKSKQGALFDRWVDSVPAITPPTQGKHIMPNDRKTSKSIASDASKLLSNDKTSEKVKRVAASALSQAAGNKKKKSR
ncbi:MAG: hypothetical protein AB7W16_19005 [Candidatus Obscuribacterales bacterium]